MNLTLLLWRENRREDACDVWLGKRFATRLATLNLELKLRELIAEVGVDLVLKFSHHSLML